jgi:TolB-like protein/class 3 adenylate cyclase
MTEQRRLAAIVSADVAGYSRLMGRDEGGTLAALKALRQEMVDPAIAMHGGRIVKTTGDGLLLEFPSVVNAVRCSVEMQTAMADRTAGIAEDRRIVFRIGINLGDIIVDGDDIFGDGVNVAARLQEIAPPGGICISNRVHEDVRDRLDVEFDDGGAQTLKNIARPVQVWHWQPGTAVTPKSATAPTALPLPDKPSIAVLPFENMSGDPEQEYFVDGLVEEIITGLSRFKSLFVIARNSTFTYKGKSVDIKQVGRELGVRYVLEGSVRKAANKVRITGQLIESESGAHIWADRYDGDLSEIFELQDKVAMDVVGAITPKLQQAEIERSGRKPTESLGAYECYLRGMAAYYTRKSESLSEARQFCQRAIELDPGFAAAYAMAAYCNAMLVGAGAKLNEALAAETSRLMSRAVELDRNDATVLTRTAWGHARVVHDLGIAAIYSERAQTLNPNLALAWAVSGWVKVWLGEPKVGIEHFSRANRLSPLDAEALFGVHGKAHAYFMAECYGEAWSTAVVAAQELKSAAGYRIAAASAAMAGHKDEAAKHMALFLRLDPDRRASNLTDVLGPYNRSDDVERYKRGLRLAGLPE